MTFYLYITFFLIGSILAYYSYHFYAKTSNLLKNGIKTTATVTELYPDPDTKSNYGVAKPYFNFVDGFQKKQRFTNGITSSPPRYKMGDKVEIVYNRNDVTQARLVSFWGLYRWSVILLMIASPFLVIGGAYLLYQW